MIANEKSTRKANQSKRRVRAEISGTHTPASVSKCRKPVSKLQEDLANALNEIDSKAAHITSKDNEISNLKNDI